MLQIGAALTDWLLAATCLFGAWRLQKYSKTLGVPPRWYVFFMWAYVSEGASCICGGFLWSTGVNFKQHSSEYTWLDLCIVSGTVIGMTLEAVALIAASQALTKNMDMTSFQVWVLAFRSVLILLVVYMVWLFAIEAPGSCFLQPCSLLAAAFPLLLQPCYKHARASGTTPGGKTSADFAWRNVTLGNVLSLAGLVLLAGLDNTCSGASCITEYLPWETSPCRWNSVVPKGASCPLPMWFNHAALMHILCACGCAVSVSGLLGLAECKWEPPKSA